MTGSMQINELKPDGEPFPDEILLSLDLGDGVRADVTIRGNGGRIMPLHVAGLKRLIDRVGDLLCDQILLTTKETKS